MIKVFGSINAENYISYEPKEDETCEQHCFETDHCILTRNASNLEVGCLELNHLDRNIKFIIDRGTSGSKISFKVTLPDNNCPAFNEINYTLNLSSGEVLNWKQTESGWEWKQCRQGWKKFERSDGTTVCLQTFRVDEGITRGASKTKCEEIGAKLTGVASVEESKWIYGKLLESGSVTDWYSFWIDGQRQCDSLGNCKFDWSDGYTKSLDALNTSTNFHESKGGEDCLAVSYMTAAPSKTINDCSCIDHKNPAGYVCGYQLI
ncbi:hypothetical protein L5515_012496 [Caenorhabditis briggsae]|uniref:C-type lectin domain-containing protein n=1 Tax=Caenorhabditis briggsae TaxID=6238 RepID=A0AAE9JGC3_CAEBR|nr:hypothetical protein L5515_012496 [Caenorhabditis briggsae]